MDIEAIIAPILFTLLSFFTRLYKIGQSNIVTWDEAQYVDTFLFIMGGFWLSLELRRL